MKRFECFKFKSRSLVSEDVLSHEKENRVNRPKVWKLMGRIEKFKHEQIEEPLAEPSTDFDGPPVFDNDDDATMSIPR